MIPSKSTSRRAEPTAIGIAVVALDGHLLVGQRPAGVPLAGLWEFPGGKVESGETPERTAIRECAEETGLAVEITGRYPSYVHDYDHGKVALNFFACRPTDSRVAPRAPWLWVSRRRLGKLEFPAGNRMLLDALWMVLPS